jgi:hypothetical protein
MPQKDEETRIQVHDTKPRGCDPHRSGLQSPAVQDFGPKSPGKAPQRHRRVAFLSPAGTVIGRDRVVSYYHDDPRRIVDVDMNVGDTFVFEATLRLLDFDEAVVIDFEDGSVDRVVKELNDCDVAVLRGSNYIHSQMNWGATGAAIERSQVRVVAFGVGVQAPRYEPVPVSPETERIMKVIAERSHSVGCRGRFTAETLERMGIRNAVPIGCPSLFRRNDRELRVVLPPAEEIRRVAFTVARGLAGPYCDAPHVARKKQLKLIQELSERYELYLITQSEKSEKLFYYRRYDRIEEAKTLMRNSGWDLAKMPWLEKLYWSRIFFGTSPAAYESMLTFCDLTLGYRLHGNIMALSSGRPAIYHTYDSRTRELVEHFAIPSYDIMSNEDFSLDAVLQPGLFDDFNARVPHAYDVMRDFLEANQVSHRMAPRPQSSCPGEQVTDPLTAGSANRRDP